MSKKTLTYKEAVKNSNRRQEFLDVYFEMNPGDAVERLIYDPVKRMAIEKVGELLERKMIREKGAKDTIEFLQRDTKQRAFVLYVQGLFARGFKFPIFATKGLFKSFKIDDFKSDLDHEYFHAKDFKDGFDISEGLRLDNNTVSLLSIDVLEAVFDTRAFIHQITNGIISNTGNIKVVRSAIEDLMKFKFILENNVDLDDDFQSKVVQAQLENCQNFIKKYIRVVKT